MIVISNRWPSNSLIMLIEFCWKYRQNSSWLHISCYSYSNSKRILNPSALRQEFQLERKMSSLLKRLVAFTPSNDLYKLLSLRPIRISSQELKLVSFSSGTYIMIWSRYTFDFEAVYLIYFCSLGYTGFSAKDVPPQVVKALLDAFSALDQRVIMRFDPSFLPYIPSNVMVSNW